MLTIILTPTMITFKNLSDEMQEELKKNYTMYVNNKGDIAIKGNETELFKTLLQLSYTYDLEII